MSTTRKRRAKIKVDETNRRKVVASAKKRSPKRSPTKRTPQKRSAKRLVKTVMRLTRKPAPKKPVRKPASPKPVPKKPASPKPVPKKPVPKKPAAPRPARKPAAPRAARKSVLKRSSRKPTAPKPPRKRGAPPPAPEAPPPAPEAPPPAPEAPPPAPAPPTDNRLTGSVLHGFPPGFGYSYDPTLIQDADILRLIRQQLGPKVSSKVVKRIFKIHRTGDKRTYIQERLYAAFVNGHLLDELREIAKQEQVPPNEMGQVFTVHFLSP